MNDKAKGNNMSESEGTKKHPDKKDVKQNKPPDREIKSLDVHSSHERLKGELGQRPQARETDQSQHPNDFFKGKSGDPFGLTGHIADMMAKEGTLTPKISKQLEAVTQKLEGEQQRKADVGERTDKTISRNTQQKMQDRMVASSSSFFEAHMQKLSATLGKPLDGVLRNIFLP